MSVDTELMVIVRGAVGEGWGTGKRRGEGLELEGLEVEIRRQVRRGQAGDLPDCCGASLLGSSRQAGLRLSEERSQEVGPLGFLAFGGLRSAWRHANVEITKDLGARFRRFPAFSGVRFRFSFSAFRSPAVSGGFLRFPAVGFPAVSCDFLRFPFSALRFQLSGFSSPVSVLRFFSPVSVLRFQFSGFRFAGFLNWPFPVSEMTVFGGRCPAFSGP